ncbi:MAG: MMPL family transporter, partial [Atribacterota bacterium]|nr:MMPL family transporter [Atribacterota bacterium]
YLAENDPEILFYQEISDKFGKFDENITLVSLEYQELFTLENLQNFKLISDQLENSDYILSVNSFLNMPNIIASDYGIEVRDFVEVFPETEKEVQELKKTALEDDMLKGTYLSNDGKVALLMIESQGNIDGSLLRKDLEGIINKYKGNIEHIEFFGLPIMEVQITEMALDNMSLAFTATIVVLALLFYCFRSIQGTFLPISIALLTSFWLLSSVASSGKAVTIVISAIPVLMIALVTAYGIHFISRYYEERQLFTPQEAIRKTIVSVFTPILMSALTTIAGFASLTTVVIRPMTEFGIFATIGIFAAFLLTIFLLGAIFSIFIPKKVPQNFSYQANDLVTKILKIIAQSIFHKKSLILGIIIITIVISSFFILQVKPDSSIESRLGVNNPITKSMNYFKEKFGGVDFLYIYLTSDNVKHPYVLRSMDKIQNYASQLSSLSQPSSITTFLAQLNNAMENKKIIPANSDKIDNLWFFTGDNEYINSMLADENRSTIIQIRAREMTSLAVDSAIQEIEKFIQNIPDRVRKVDVSSLSAQEQEQYLPYIVQDIISSWQANGMEINEDIKRELYEELIQIAKMPIENFYYPTNEFIAKILQISILELEDLGISTSEMQPTLLKYLESHSRDNQFIDYFAQELDLYLDDAQYLKEILDSSLTIVGEREKIRYARTQIEHILKNQLEQKSSEYLWYLTDEYAYLPDEQGDIHFAYRLTGIPVIINEVNYSVFQGQIKSMVIAFVIVFILLVLQFSSLLIGLMAMIPIACTVLTAFGIMGIAKISLNIGTMMVASISIGAGIDYTIHFINRYRQELTKYKNEPTQAMKNTLTGTGRAVVFNSLSVAAGAFVLTLSEIDMISEFAGLIGSVMLISVVYTLLLLPLLLHLITFKISEKL